MAYAFEIGDELPDPPTKAEVEADIIDWKARLGVLMTNICQWAEEFPGVVCERGMVSKIERKMLIVGIKEPVELPGVLIRRLVTQSVTPVPHDNRTDYMNQLGLPGRIHRNERSLTVMPDARWVVGTRGQVWIRSNIHFDTIADIGVLGHPDWRLIQRETPEQLTPFTKEVLHELIGRLQ